MKRFRRIGTWFISNLGACRKCMRLSFITAALAGIAVTGAWFRLGQSPVTAFLTPAALALILLWIGHVVTFAARASTKQLQPAPTDAVRDPARRALIPVFAKILVGAALATALPARFDHGDGCGPGEWCCRHDFSKPGSPCIKCCKK
jgi:hypothetical protein